MAKPGFSPVLILGMGEQAERIMQQIKVWQTTLPSSLQQLVEFLWLDSLGNEPLAELLQARVDLLKRGGLLQQAATTGRIRVRNDGGPLEIKVYVLGPLTRNKGGLSLDKLVAELSKLRYAWQPSMGFTGATITTLTWPEGASPRQELVLQRALGIYRSEDFLDAFAGRILVLDRVAQDGSQVEWGDFNLALARLIYLSIIPGDEPPLLPELGLIRRDERDSKLGTLGIHCVSVCPPDALSQVIRELDNWAQSWLEGKNTDTPAAPVASGEMPVSLWEQITEQALCHSLREVKEQKDPVQTVTAKFMSLLDADLEEKLRSQDAVAAMRYLGAVEQRLTTLHHTLQGKTRRTVHLAEPSRLAEPARVPVVVEEPVGYVEEGRSGGTGSALLVVLLLEAGLYRLTANGIIPEGLGWILGIVFFGTVFLYLMGINRSGLTWVAEAEMKPIFTNNVLEVVEEAGVEPDPELESCVELMLQHCRSGKQDLRKLGRALREVVQQFSEQGAPMLNQRIEISGETKQINPLEILPSRWRQLSQSECRDSIMKQLYQRVEECSRLLEAGDKIIGQSWQELNNIPDPLPLLLLRQGHRPLRKIALLAASPKLGKSLATRNNRRLVNGEAGTLCVINLYLGLEPGNLDLGSKAGQTDSAADRKIVAEV